MCRKILKKKDIKHKSAVTVRCMKANRKYCEGTVKYIGAADNPSLPWITNCLLIQENYEVAILAREKLFSCFKGQDVLLA